MEISGRIIRHLSTFKELKGSIKTTKDFLNGIKDKIKPEHKTEFANLVNYLVVALRSRYSGLEGDKHSKYFIDSEKKHNYSIDDKGLLNLLQKFDSSFTKEDVELILVACTHKHTTFSSVDSYPKSAVMLLEALNIKPNEKRLTEIKTMLESNKLGENIDYIYRNSSSEITSAITLPPTELIKYIYTFAPRTHSNLAKKHDYTDIQAYKLTSVDNMDKTIEVISSADCKITQLDFAENLLFEADNAVKIIDSITPNISLLHISSINIMKPANDSDAEKQLSQSLMKLYLARPDFKITFEDKNDEYIISFKPSKNGLSEFKPFHLLLKHYQTLTILATYLKDPRCQIYQLDLTSVNFDEVGFKLLIEPFNCNGSLQGIKINTPKKVNNYNECRQHISAINELNANFRPDFRVHGSYDTEENDNTTYITNINFTKLDELKPFTPNTMGNWLIGNLSSPHCELESLNFDIPTYKNKDALMFLKSLAINLSKDKSLTNIKSFKLNIESKLEKELNTAIEYLNASQNKFKFEHNKILTGVVDSGEKYFEFKITVTAAKLAPAKHWLTNHLGSAESSIRNLQEKSIPVFKNEEVLDFIGALSNNLINADKKLTDIPGFTIDIDKNYVNKVKTAIGTLNKQQKEFQFSIEKGENNKFKINVQKIT